MSLLSKSFTVLNTLTIALGLGHSAFALDPTTLYQKAFPAVAVIEAPDGKSISQGSGFVTDPSGLILTNYHVVGNNTQVTVKLADGSIYRGVVVSRNPRFDVALVQIRPQRRLSSLRMQLVPPRVGQKVYAIGNPSGLNRSLSDGIVSRIDASGQIQYTATSSYGSSGGPLLNEDGQVIGIVRGGIPGTNLNFALPVGAANNLPTQQGSAAQQRQQVTNYQIAGILELRQGNYQAALKLFDEGIRRYPNNEILYSNRGVVKGLLGDVQGSLSDYDRSIQLKPSSLAHKNRAKIYAVLKHPQQAVKALTDAISLNQNWGESNIGEAFYDRGRIQVQLNNPKAAISDFKQAARFFSQIGNAGRYQAALDQITLLTAQ